VDSDDNYQMLEQAEGLDSDEVRNDDGDEVVDPPDRWIKAADDESLDERLAAEIPDGSPEDPPASQSPDAEDGAIVMVSDDELDRIDPANHGRASGQIDGTPEDGDSFYNIER
jgi:hypothetical protein